MIIKSIRVKDYRNYEDTVVELDKALNIIVGDNAQGKTNLLEAIYVAGFAKSFRTNKDSDLVGFNTQYNHVKMVVERANGYEETIEFRIHQNGKKEFLLNSVNITKVSELLGAINIILFYPDDLKLIKESPTERRKFLNRELSHISRLYCNDIIEYNKILLQRNELLKTAYGKPGLKETLEIWDEQLAHKGARIIAKRVSFIAKLSTISQGIHSRVSNGKENLSLRYISNVKNFENYDTIKGDLMALLAKNSDMDMRRGFTSVGPHRDDLEILLNGINIKSFGSQGQQRTAALSLKLSEIEIIKEEVGEWPILLLDDVMSELDHKRQKDLIYALKDVQTIITTTEIDNLLDDYINASKIIKINNGSVLT